MPSELLGKKILIVVTSGPQIPERCVGPFFFANSAARNKAEVSMLFAMSGSILLKQGVAETICAKEGGRPVRGFLDDCLKAGVKLYVCAASLKLNDMVADDLIDDVENLVGSSFIFTKGLESDMVLNF